MAGKWGALEVFKFCTYISIPIFMTIAIAGQPKTLEALIKNRGYVIYPQEAARPPTAEEFYEIARKNKERSAQQ